MSKIHCTSTCPRPRLAAVEASRARLVICEIQNSRFHAFVFSPPSCSTDACSHPLSSSNERHVCVAAGIQASRARFFSAVQSLNQLLPALRPAVIYVCAQQEACATPRAAVLLPFFLYLIPILASGLTTRRRFRRVWRPLGNLDGADQVSCGPQRLRRPSFGFGTSLPQVTHHVLVLAKRGRVETVVT